MSAFLQEGWREGLNLSKSGAREGEGAGDLEEGGPEHAGAGEGLGVVEGPVEAPLHLPAQAPHQLQVLDRFRVSKDPIS